MTDVDLSPFIPSRAAPGVAQPHAAPFCGVESGLRFQLVKMGQLRPLRTPV